MGMLQSIQAGAKYSVRNNERENDPFVFPAFSTWVAEAILFFAFSTLRQKCRLTAFLPLGGQPSRNPSH